MVACTPLEDSGKLPAGAMGTSGRSDAVAEGALLSGTSVALGEEDVWVLLDVVPLDTSAAGT